MIKLSDTQLTLLSAAAQRPDGNLLPLPGSLRGGAATKVVAALLTRGLIREEVIESHAKADAALNRLWRALEDGRGVRLRITPNALEALGIEVADAGVAAHEAAGSAIGGEEVPETVPEPATGPHNARVRNTREGTKQAALVAMLQRPEGATIAEVVEATGWQPHTVRGALAGALKKRLGLTIVSEKIEGRGRVYRLG
jgi:hypothetical protein